MLYTVNITEIYTKGDILELVTHENFPNLAYDYKTGLFYRVSYTKSGAFKVKRQIFPDHDGMIAYYDSAKKCVMKRKAARYAWEMMVGPIDRMEKVYFRDHDHRNLKLSNLIKLSFDEYERIKEAKENLSGGIKIVPHERLAYVYKVIYKHKGKKRVRVCHDVVTANKFKRRLELLQLKVVTKYSLSD